MADMSGMTKTLNVVIRFSTQREGVVDKALDKTKKKVKETGGWFDKLNKSFKTSGVRLFSLLFVLRRVHEGFKSLFAPVMDAYGVSQLFSNTLLVVMLPVMQLLYPIILDIAQLFMRLPESMKLIIGGAALLGWALSGLAESFLAVMIGTQAFAGKAGAKGASEAISLFGGKVSWLKNLVGAGLVIWGGIRLMDFLMDSSGKKISLLEAITNAGMMGAGMGLLLGKGAGGAAFIIVIGMEMLKQPDLFTTFLKDATVAFMKLSIIIQAAMKYAWDNANPAVSAGLMPRTSYLDEVKNVAGYMNPQIDEVSKYLDGLGLAMDGAMKSTDVLSSRQIALAQAYSANQQAIYAGTMSFSSAGGFTPAIADATGEVCSLTSASSVAATSLTSAALSVNAFEDSLAAYRTPTGGFDITGGGLGGNYGYGESSGTVVVSDALIGPKGNVISTSPDDYLIATKNPGGLGGGGGMNVTYNVYVQDKAQIEAALRAHDKNLAREMQRLSGARVA